MEFGVYSCRRVAKVIKMLAALKTRQVVVSITWAQASLLAVDFCMNKEMFNRSFARNPKPQALNPKP